MECERYLYEQIKSRPDRKRFNNKNNAKENEISEGGMKGYVIERYVVFQFRRAEFIMGSKWIPIRLTDRICELFLSSNNFRFA